MRSVYIHIPFCRSICSYCDFCKMIYNDLWANDYLDALLKEIEKYYEGDLIKTIYIGGGTPSSLSLPLLNKLFEIIKIFKLSPLNEITFELNVDDINEDILKILKENNVNRISVVIQSFNNKKLKFLNRKHNSKDIFKKIKLLKSYGFDNINVDFMYALPVEDMYIFKKDLKKFIKLGVEHISTYSLIIEDNTALKINNVKPIDETLDYLMYKYITKKLRKKGYNHYEVSNFAKVGHQSSHNLVYWNNEEYYGFGLGSHGYINDVRYENVKNLVKYLDGEYRKEEYIVSLKEDMENEVIFGLRKLEGINIRKFFEKYDKNIQDVFNIEKALKNKYLILENEYLKIPEGKIYVMNEILNMIIK